MFTFITGGLRSGKSAYGLRRASELGPPPWLYVAIGAASAGDEQLKQRLAGSRRDQEAIWKVKDAPAQLSSLFDPHEVSPYGSIVIDGFTQWLAGRVGKNVPSNGQMPADVAAELSTLADRMYRSKVPIVVVTTEVGLGYAAHQTGERAFLDIAGEANQILAASAASVVLMVSGVPLRLR